MNGTRRLKLVLGVGVSCLLLAACGEGSTGTTDGGAEAEFTTQLQLGTGSTGGTYYPLGGEIATVLSDTVDVEGFSVSAIETGASVENMAKIGSGDLQLGMAVNGTAAQAAQGTESFEGKAVENFGYITQLYPEILHVVTLESSGIDSIADLEGEKVAIGPPGSGTNLISRKLLAAYGIEEGDYQAFQEDFGVAAAKLRDGNIAANIAVLGSPAAGVDQLQATTKEVRYLDVEGDALAQLVEDTTYGEFTIAADTYSWLDRDVSTIAARAILLASTDTVSPDVGYAVTKALIESADQISHQQARFITLENALQGRLDLPLHPGAERYYEEQGVLG